MIVQGRAPDAQCCNCGQPAHAICGSQLDDSTMCFACLDELDGTLPPHSPDCPQNMTHADGGSASLGPDLGATCAACHVARATRDGTRRRSPAAADSPRPSLPSHNYSNVKLDAWHAMDRIKVPRNHPLALSFWRAFRDAIFARSKTDWDRVAEVLTAKGINIEEMWQHNPRYILQRVRRVIPEPDILVPALREVLTKYKDVNPDPKTGRKLLDADAVKAFENLINTHAARGCLSDPPGVELYQEMRRDRDGLKVYRCLRGTSDIEGGLHQKMNQSFGSWRMGPELADAVIALWRHGHNVRAGARFESQLKKLESDRLWYLDWIQHFTTEIYGEPDHAWYQSSLDFGKTDEVFGIVPLVLPEGVEPDVITPAVLESLKKDNKYSSSALFLVQKQKSLIPYLPMHTKDEAVLFRQSVSKYSSDGAKEPNFDKMAKDWNDCTLVGLDGMRKANGTTIFRKTAGMLRRHYNGGYKSSNARHAAHDEAPESLKALEGFMLEQWFVEEDLDEILEGIREASASSTDRVEMAGGDVTEHDEQGAEDVSMDVDGRYIRFLFFAATITIVHSFQIATMTIAALPWMMDDKLDKLPRQRSSA